MGAVIHKMHKRFSKPFLCLFVSLSFFAILAPISSASSDKANAMACCVGKTAGHCDSGIPAHKTPPPPREPMCGLDNSEIQNDDITIVAEPAHNESHHSLSQTAETTSRAAESASVSKPCQMECGACAASVSRTQRRERGIVQPATSLNPSIVVHSRFENQPFYFLSYEDWAQTSPRGPPADLL
jgi:hypothetical protein